MPSGNKPPKCRKAFPDRKRLRHFGGELWRAALPQERHSGAPGFFTSRLGRTLSKPLSRFPRGSYSTIAVAPASGQALWPRPGRCQWRSRRTRRDPPAPRTPSAAFAPRVAAGVLQLVDPHGAQPHGMGRQHHIFHSAGAVRHAVRVTPSIAGNNKGGRVVKGIILRLGRSQRFLSRRPQLLHLFRINNSGEPPGLAVHGAAPRRPR